eukprot:10766574-Alexandrium_andersonii.AAC.1
MQFVGIWWEAGRAAQAPDLDGFSWSEWNQAGSTSESANADAGAGVEDQQPWVGARPESANADDEVGAFEQRGQPDGSCG